MRRIAAGALLLAAACSVAPQAPPAARSLPVDTPALGSLGPFSLGMSLREVEAAAAARGEALTCHLRRGLFLCRPDAGPAGSAPYSLAVRGDSLVSLSWDLPLPADSVRRRYAGLGATAAEMPARGPAGGTLLLWLSEDGATQRLAICLPAERSCSVSVSRVDPDEARRRIGRARAASPAPGR